MANLKDCKKLLVRAKTISLPDWMWDIIDKKGKRSGYIREVLMEVKEIKEKEEKNGESDK